MALPLNMVSITQLRTSDLTTLHMEVDAAQFIQAWFENLNTNSSNVAVESNVMATPQTSKLTETAKRLSRTDANSALCKLLGTLSVNAITPLTESSCPIICCGVSRDSLATPSSNSHPAETSNISTRSAYFCDESKSTLVDLRCNEGEEEEEEAETEPLMLSTTERNLRTVCNPPRIQRMSAFKGVQEALVYEHLDEWFVAVETHAAHSGVVPMKSLHTVRMKKVRIRMSVRVKQLPLTDVSTETGCDIAFRYRPVGQPLPQARNPRTENSNSEATRPSSRWWWRIQRPPWFPKFQRRRKRRTENAETSIRSRLTTTLTRLFRWGPGQSGHRQPMQPPQSSTELSSSMDAVSSTGHMSDATSVSLRNLDEVSSLASRLEPIKPKEDYVHYESSSNENETSDYKEQFSTKSGHSLRESNLGPSGNTGISNIPKSECVASSPDGNSPDPKVDPTDPDVIVAECYTSPVFQTGAPSSRPRSDIGTSPTQIPNVHEVRVVVTSSSHARTHSSILDSKITELDCAIDDRATNAEDADAVSSWDTSGHYAGPDLRGRLPRCLLTSAAGPLLTDSSLSEPRAVRMEARISREPDQFHITIASVEGPPRGDKETPHGITLLTNHIRNFEYQNQTTQSEVLPTLLKKPGLHQSGRHKNINSPQQKPYLLATTPSDQMGEPFCLRKNTDILASINTLDRLKITPKDPNRNDTAITAFEGMKERPIKRYQSAVTQTEFRKKTKLPEGSKRRVRVMRTPVSIPRFSEERVVMSSAIRRRCRQAAERAATQTVTVADTTDLSSSSSSSSRIDSVRQPHHPTAQPGDVTAQREAHCPLGIRLLTLPPGYSESQAKYSGAKSVDAALHQCRACKRTDSDAGSVFPLPSQQRPRLFAPLQLGEKHSTTRLLCGRRLFKGTPD